MNGYNIEAWPLEVDDDQWSILNIERKDNFYEKKNCFFNRNFTFQNSKTNILYFEFKIFHMSTLLLKNENY